MLNDSQAQTACSRGDLERLKLLYEQKFSAKAVCEQHLDMNRQNIIFDEIDNIIVPRWAALAVSSGQTHVVAWIMQRDDTTIDSEDDPVVEAVVRAYYARLISPIGTIEDALMMCDKMCWWSHNPPYIFRTAWALRRLCDDDNAPMMYSIEIVPDIYVWNPRHDIVLFRCGTPEYIRTFLGNHGDNRLVTHVIQLAAKACHSNNTTLMLRMINVADALVDYGFEIDDGSIRMADCFGMLRSHGRLLIQKMVKVIRLAQKSLPMRYVQYLRAFQHTGLEALLLRRLPKDLVDHIIYCYASTS